MKEYQVLKYDANCPVDKAVSVPLFSRYGLAVKVYQGGEPAELSASQISVDGTASSGTLRGYNLFELSSGSIPCMKQLDVVVDKRERRTIEGTREVNQSSTKPTTISFYLLDKVLDDMTIKAADLMQVVGECEISAVSGGQVEHETLGLSDLWVLGREVPVPGTPTSYWHVVDGKWKNEAGDKTTDTLYTVLTTLSAGRFITKQKYGKSTATCQYTIVLRTSEDVKAGFKLVVRETDMGRIEIEEQD